MLAFFCGDFLDFLAVLARDCHDITGFSSHLLADHQVLLHRLVQVVDNLLATLSHEFLEPIECDFSVNTGFGGKEKLILRG